jgi:putative pyruvate formate lyase activating enzyme
MKKAKGDPIFDPRFQVAADFEPAYLEAFRSGMLFDRVDAGLEELGSCTACPRNCRINRLNDEKKVCHTGRHAMVASAFPHFGEEDCLRGGRGSGTIFFSLCNLRCVFCQNWDISQRQRGQEQDAGAIADLMIDLQEMGCHNINFVTPEHVVPQVIEALAEATQRGLTLPIVYNTSAYDSISSLRLLDGLVDIYMPDFKFWSRESGRDYVKAKDYAPVAKAAIAEMHRQVGSLRFDDRGLAKRGVLVRHLVMPGLLDESASIFNWLSSEISPDTWVNIMGQYRPEYEVESARTRDGKLKYSAIARCPTEREMDEAYALARKAGLWRFDERRHGGIVLRVKR